ncbi:MAG: YgjV family protein [Planctomycetota bacterium]
MPDSDPSHLALALGFAGAFMNVVWPLFPGRRGMLLAQVGVSVFFGAHYALTGAVTGAIMNTLAMVQALLAIPLGERPGFRIAYLATLPVIAACLWASWSGPPSAFAAAGFALVSLGRYQLSTIRFRVLLLAAIPPWIAHNVAVGSIPGLVADACALVAGSLALGYALRQRGPRI